MRLFGKNTSNTPEKVWKSIDEMPLYNWIKCTEDDDIRYVCKDINDSNDVDLVGSWSLVYDDYINRFGLSKLYRRLLEVMRTKALLECDYVITKEAFNLTLIKMEEEKLKQMLANKGEGATINSVLVYLSKWLGYHLNVREITALEYFEMMKQYGKENKQKRHK